MVSRGCTQRSLMRSQDETWLHSLPYVDLPFDSFKTFIQCCQTFELFSSLELFDCLKLLNTCMNSIQIFRNMYIHCSLSPEPFLYEDHVLTLFCGFYANSFMLRFSELRRHRWSQRDGNSWQFSAVMNGVSCRYCYLDCIFIFLLTLTFPRRKSNYGDLTN